MALSISVNKTFKWRTPLPILRRINLVVINVASGIVSVFLIVVVINVASGVVSLFLIVVVINVASGIVSLFLIVVMINVASGIVSLFLILVVINVASGIVSLFLPSPGTSVPATTSPEVNSALNNYSNNTPFLHTSLSFSIS